MYRKTTSLLRRKHLRKEWAHWPHQSLSFAEILGVPAKRTAVSKTRGQLQLQNEGFSHQNPTETEKRLANFGNL